MRVWVKHIYTELQATGHHKETRVLLKRKKTPHLIDRICDTVHKAFVNVSSKGADRQTDRQQQRLSTWCGGSDTQLVLLLCSTVNVSTCPFLNIPRGEKKNPKEKKEMTSLHRYFEQKGRKTKCRE